MRERTRANILQAPERDDAYIYAIRTLWAVVVLKRGHQFGIFPFTRDKCGVADWQYHVVLCSATHSPMFLGDGVSSSCLPDAFLIFERDQSFSDSMKGCWICELSSSLFDYIQGKREHVSRGDVGSDQYIVTALHFAPQPFRYVVLRLFSRSRRVVSHSCWC